MHLISRADMSPCTAYKITGQKLMEACFSQAQVLQGMDTLLEAIEARLRDLLVPVDVLVPWKEGSLSGEIHKVCTSCSSICFCTLQQRKPGILPVCSILTLESQRHALAKRLQIYRPHILCKVIHQFQSGTTEVIQAGDAAL